MGIEEVCRQAIAKYVQPLYRENKRAACGSVHVCTGLEAGIKSAPHTVKLRAEEKETMVFGDWEVDGVLCEQEAADGDIQDSLPDRLARDMIESHSPPPDSGWDR